MRELSAREEYGRVRKAKIDQCGMKAWGQRRVLAVGSFGIPRLANAMMVTVLRCGAPKRELQWSVR